MKDHTKKDDDYLQYIWFVFENVADPKEYYKYDEEIILSIILSIIYNGYFKYCETKIIDITADNYSFKGCNDDDFIDCARNNDYEKLFCIQSQEFMKR